MHGEQGRADAHALMRWRDKEPAHEGIDETDESNGCFIGASHPGFCLGQVGGFDECHLLPKPFFSEEGWAWLEASCQIDDSCWLSAGR